MVKMWPDVAVLMCWPCETMRSDEQMCLSNFRSALLLSWCRRMSRSESVFIALPLPVLFVVVYCCCCLLLLSYRRNTRATHGRWAT